MKTKLPNSNQSPACPQVPLVPFALQVPPQANPLTVPVCPGLSRFVPLYFETTYECKPPNQPLWPGSRAIPPSIIPSFHSAIPSLQVRGPAGVFRPPKPRAFSAASVTLPQNVSIRRHQRPQGCRDRSAGRLSGDVPRRRSVVCAAHLWLGD